MQKRLEGKHILIVDDDEDILSSMDLAMRGEGAQTTLATDGSAAVDAFHRREFDVIVLDMMLPKASGFVVMDKIRELDHPPMVVMVTANQGKRHMAYAESLGVAAYLYKPVPLSRLVDTVAGLLQTAPQREEA